VECINVSFEKGELSPSQKQAVITLIEKKDLDRCDLKNWKPISLLNIDVKIASRIIAERMKRLLSGLIHHNQTGYIPRRNIGAKNISYGVIKKFRSRAKLLSTDITLITV